MSYDLTSQDYAERVYAGVLGKMIGVYLGRPIEGMPYRDILKTLGPIEYYVHAQRKRELIVTDDDLTGTFIFVRALEDHANTPETLTAQQIGQTWLNYVIENKTIFWWGGLGLSTEHTAFLRLKQGIPAPQSGSIELNSKVVAEQIGSQIFIDAWPMVVPGDPKRAADLARKAASVSHDGEAIYGAQVIAAMESMAFVENNLDRLLDTAVALIPGDSVIARMIADLRAFHTNEPNDWERAMVEVLEKSYGYDKFGGNCHIVPNHGVVILALLYGRDDFSRAQMIANTCGWDTDCNAGNVGCLMGIKNGLAGIDAGPDWRGPVADRLMLPTADGGECITDAVREADRIVNIGRAAHGLLPLRRKNGARFHFSFPGSLQGFAEVPGADSSGAATLANADGRLAIRFQQLAKGRTARVATPTFAPPKAIGGVYELLASPTLYSGQTIRAALQAGDTAGNAVSACCFVRYYAEADRTEYLRSAPISLPAGQAAVLTWKIPPTDGRPVFEVGIEISGENGVSGTVFVDFLTWDGEPDLHLGILAEKGTMSRRQWVEALHGFRLVHDDINDLNKRHAYFAVQNQGRGLAIIGTRDWHDYSVSAELTPHLAQAAGLAVRVRGLARYYALLLRHPGRVALVKMYDGERTLAEAPLVWQWNDDPHQFELEIIGNRIRGSVDGRILFDVTDTDHPIPSGGAALVIEEGRLISGPVRIQPAERRA